MDSLCTTLTSLGVAFNAVRDRDSVNTNSLCGNKDLFNKFFIERMNEVMEGMSVIIGYSCGGVYNFVDFGLHQYDNVLFSVFNI